jgi:hypothetical protein
MAIPALKKIPAKFIIIGILGVLVLILLTINLATNKKKPVSTFNPLPLASGSGFPILNPSSSPKMSETEKGDPQYYEEFNRQILEACPLYPYLPYETPLYKIKCSGKLQLTVNLKTASLSASLKQEINDWVSSKGINPTTHEIIYK